MNVEEDNIKIEKDILKSFFNLKKKILIDQDYSENIRAGWTKSSFQNKYILKSVSKPKLLKRLFCLVVDDNFWEQISLSDKKYFDHMSRNKDLFIKLIYIFNGLNPTSKTLDELVKFMIDQIGFQEYMLSTSGEISYRKINVIEDSISNLRQPLLSLLKDSREYLEAISIIWKWNSISSENDREDYAINNFTLHGLQKIIRNNPQSTRNRFGELAKKSPEAKVDELESKIHEFIKPEKYIESLKPKKISTLKTGKIEDYLKKNGYATSIYWTHFADYKIALKVIELKTSSKENFNKLLSGIGFTSDKVKMICFGEDAVDYFLPRIQKDLYKEEPILKDSPFGYLVSINNFFWPNDVNNQLYKSIDELGKYDKFTIDQRFLEVCADIKEYGIETFYSEKKIQKLSYFERPFKSLYEENKDDFTKVLGLINNIQEELSKIDHLVITCPSTSGDEQLPKVENLVTIANFTNKSSNQSEKVITTCVFLDPFDSYEEELKNEWEKENKDRIDTIKIKCDSIIRFDQERFIEVREGNISSVIQRMRGHGTSEYKEKIYKMIDDELLDILNNIIVIYVNLSIEEYRYYMRAGASIVGKYEVYWDDYVYVENKQNWWKKIEMEKEIEKKYSHLIYDQYDMKNEYNSCGRLMITSSKMPISSGTKSWLDELSLFKYQGSDTLLQRDDFPDQDDKYFTLTFIQS